MLKEKYKKMFCVVREELNKADPLGVVLENPNLCDEYDYENQLPYPLLISTVVSF